MPLRRTLPLLLILLLALLPSCEPPPRPPNVIILFADDLGYGDLGTFGHPTIRTPHLDRMAAEGMKFTQFYVAASVCTPSRAGLLTGRLPVRSGMASDRRRVLFPDSELGLPASELTIAEVLKERGYATGAFGKWHLGHLPDFLPTNHGFDTYFGIPYSNDMDRVVPHQNVNAPRPNIWRDPEIEYWNVPILRDLEVVERPAEQHTITKRYTEEAIAFIQTNRTRPFFVYLPYSLPHVPLFASEAFEGTSPRGLYGDVVEEIDWSVGQILDTLHDLGLAENTLVIFTSDNGPWLVFDEHGGSAGLLREGKGTTWEGGMRVPTIAWWPGTIAPGTVTTALATTMDLLPTAAAMAEVDLPSDRVYDGVNLLPLLRGETERVREVVPYFRGTQLYAIRKGPWKAHFITQSAYAGDTGPTPHTPAELYHLEHDPGEQYNVAAQHPRVIADLTAEAERLRVSITPVPDRLVPRIGD